MSESLSNFLFATSKVSFTTTYPPEDAVVRLAASVKKKPPFPTFLRQTVVGGVSVDKVVLYCYRPFLMRWGRPVFRGRFLNSEGKTVLEGFFSIHWVLKAFFSAWLGLVSATPIFAIYVGVYEARQSGGGMMVVSAAVIFGLVGALITGLVGVGLLRLGRPLAIRDQEYISGVIKTSFSPDKPNSSLQTDR